MCSKRCAKPVRPGGSFADPTWYHRLTATIGAVWSSESVTKSPFDKRNVSIGMRIGLNCTGRTTTGTLTPLRRLGLRTMRLFLLIAAGLVVLYAGTMIVLWRFQERVVFQPPGDA